MKRKYLQLERVLNDFILTEWRHISDSKHNGNHDDSHHNGRFYDIRNNSSHDDSHDNSDSALYKSLPRFAEISRTTSSSCPSRILGRSFDVMSRDAVEKHIQHGADNSAFC